MENDPDQADGLLRQPSSHLSDYSLNSNSTLVTSPSSPPLHRHGHRRVDSALEEDASDRGAGVSQQGSNGLGITSLNEQRPVSIPRKPVNSKSSSVNSGFADLLVSPMSTYRSGELRFHDEQEENLHSDSNLSSHQPFTANSDREPLERRLSSNDADFECRMKKRPGSGRGSWLAVSILVLAIYSTVFSGIWLIIAIMKLQYGRTVSRGGVPFATASTLYTAFAKSIELSFVTVFVAFIGQVLSKRALLQSRGVTMAEMTMRSWIMQPGSSPSGIPFLATRSNLGLPTRTSSFARNRLSLRPSSSSSYPKRHANSKIHVGIIISHWESVRYGASTKLGMLALLVALMAMTYTTASEALVTPVLKFSKTESRLMYGKVSTSFANTYYIMGNCNTPISVEVDGENSGETCIQIQHSAQSYHNYMQYLTSWVENISSRNGSDSMTQRPDPVGMLYDNTTLKGSWINVQNMTNLSEQYQRIVNNVTMAMPHAGVVAAAMDPINGIIQPSDLNVSLPEKILAVYQNPNI